MNDSMHKLLKHILIAVTSLLLLLALIIVSSAIICSFAITTNEYEVTIDGLSSSVRIACIADLHGKEFGEGNSRLISKIEAQEPDAIFVVGDMVGPDATEEEAERFVELVSALQEIAPVFVSNGNHEQEYIETTGDDLFGRIADLGVTVVDDSFVDVELAGSTLRIGGTLDYLCGYGLAEGESSPLLDMMDDFNDTDLPKILLAHMPFSALLNGGYTNWDIDLVVSGHTHGGLIRIPFVGGLYAPPWEEWWPTYDMGYFELENDTQMVITSGLSGYKYVPRIFNLPEVCVITLLPS
ncbi:MAG: metallophosphoesterase [Clostridiales bacterium]|nr:metallophosphoesterase [Clostridiales bacterium]